MNDRRATVLHVDPPATSGGSVTPEVWIAAERLQEFRAIHEHASLHPPIDPPASYANETWTFEDALVEILRGRLDGVGPTTVNELAASLSVPQTKIEQALARLEGEGFAMQGSFTPERNEIEWCSRRLLARIHSYTLNRLRKEIEPVSAADFLRFLFVWQKVAPDHQLEGAESVASILDQLEGFEAPAGSWESEILPVGRAHVLTPVTL